MVPGPAFQVYLYGLDFFYLFFLTAETCAMNSSHVYRYGSANEKETDMISYRPRR